MNSNIKNDKNQSTNLADSELDIVTNLKILLQWWNALPKLHNPRADNYFWV